MKHTHLIIVISIIVVIFVLGIFVFLYTKDNKTIANHNESTASITTEAETYKVYTAPEINTIEDAEQVGMLQFPEGSYVDAYWVENYDGDEPDPFTPYKPYAYDIRIIVPKETEEEFLAYLRAKHWYEEAGDLSNHYMAKDEDFWGTVPDGNAYYLFEHMYNALEDEQGRLPVSIYLYVIVTNDSVLVWLSA